jgi:phosphoserine phosphatase
MRLTGIVGELGAALLELEPGVFNGRLTRARQVHPAPGPAGVERLRAEAEALGLSLEAVPVNPTGSGATHGAHVLTVIGPALGAAELHQVAQVLAQHDASIRRIGRLSSGAVHALELHLGLRAGESPEPLRRALLVLSTATGLDVALQPESLFRRAKRLVVMDMDSTLIRIEVIDELARAAGVTDQVSAITHRAMMGELDYDESLRQRLALLKGLDVTVLERIAANLPLTEGAETLVRVLKRLGYRLAVLSGGFSIAAEALQARLGLDEAFSNRLEIEDGKLTGNVVGPIVNGQRKAELLEAIARREGIPLAQVIAVGDGANDLQMLERAGLGIAFRAKPKLREAADLSITASGLDAILFLLGISAEEIAEASGN